MFFGLKPEICDPVLRVGRTYGLKDADGNHVFRFLQRGSQIHRAFKLAIVIFWFPRLTSCDTGIKKQRRIIDHGGWCKALFKRGRIDKRLEAGARLPPCLRDVVEFVFLKIETTDQRLNRSIPGVQCNKSTFNFR